MVTVPLRQFYRDQRGAALIELGFAVPILVLIFLGCFEATRYVMIHQKLDRIAASMADLVSQAEGISTAQVDDLFCAAEQIAEPYDLGGNGRILVSSVYRPTSSAPTVAWQRLSPGALAVTSRIGATSGTATLPGNLTVRTGENIIVAEVWFAYEPLFANSLFDAFTLYHSAFNRPRVMNLTTINATGPSGCS